MKRRGFTLVELLLVVAIVAVLAVLLFPLFTRSGGVSCQSNLKQIGLGTLIYKQDYDEVMPLSSMNGVSSSLPPYSRPYGWADAIQPYVKRTQVFQCPAETQGEAGTDAVQTGFTDYWFNTNLSGAREILPLARTENEPPFNANVLGARPKPKGNWFFTAEAATVVMFGDGNDGFDLTDARYNRNSLPLAWLHNQDSPARRHLGRGNYLFADGHVKSFEPQAITSTRAQPGDLSFALK